MSDSVEKPFFWVFGASKGIGLASSKKLLEMGYFVIGFSRTKPFIEDPFFHWEKVDLLKTQELEPFLKKTGKKFPKIKGVLLNAGKGLLGNLEEYSYKNIETTLFLNLLAPMVIVKTLLPSLKKEESAHLIAVVSEAGLVAKKKGSVYSATKFGLKGFFQAMQDELKNSSLYINLLYPGVCNTPFFDTLGYTPEKGSLEPKEVAELLPLILSQKEGTWIPEIQIFPKKGKLTLKKKAMSDTFVK